MDNKFFLFIDLKHNEYIITVQDSFDIKSDKLTREEMSVELSELLYELTHVEEGNKNE